MSEITRRSFLKQGGATAAAAGALVATPRILRGTSTSSPTKAPRKTSASAHELDATRDLVVHVPDTKRDEVHLLVADREVVLHDHDLVARLARAAH